MPQDVEAASPAVRLRSASWDARPASPEANKKARPPAAQPSKKGAAPSNIALYIAGLFVFYMAHDALQERAFRRPGFEFGWFMTAVELGTMFACALVWEGAKRGTAYAPGAFRYLGALVLGIAISQGTGSVALQHVNYPVKVAFKACKLVPTMLVSRCVNNRTYGAPEYAAAVLMCASLAVLGLADLGSATDRETQIFGMGLLVVAVFSDAVIPNLQEKLLRGLKVPLGEMVLLSNFGSFFLVLVYVAYTGELVAALTYCAARPDAAALLLAQALAGYAGLRCYLSVIKNLSGVAGVLTTSARKVFTLILSFLLFKKPFTLQHALGLALLFLGVGLSIASKHRRPR